MNDCVSWGNLATYFKGLSHEQDTQLGRQCSELDQQVGEPTSGKRLLLEQHYSHFRITPSLSASLSTPSAHISLVWLAVRHYQPTFDSLNDKLSKCSSLEDQAHSTIISQNAVIAVLQQAGADKEKAAKGASAKDDYAKANDVLAERVDSPDVCAAAASAFDAELARERAQ